SMFPSELFNAVEIYKTQSASFIEGGVSGQIALGTLRPLDYNERRTQAEIKGNYNPDNADIDGANNEIGYRGTFSYVDQWETGAGGDIGISIGYQTNQGSNPEQEYRTSSAWRDCRNDPNVDAGVYASGNCDSGQGDLVMEVDPETGTAPDQGTPFIMVPSQRTYRQNTTDDDRESLFAAMQFRPNDRVDINIDGEWSDRTFTEIRNDLVFAEQRRVNPEGLVSAPDGSVTSFTNEGRIETLSTYQEREEEYKGGGINVSYMATERLELLFDVSYSNTERTENIVHTRLQSEPTDIFGNPTPAGTDRPDAFYLLRGGPAEIGVVTVENFDVTNHDLFADNARTRIDLNQDRENTITAGRVDFDLEMDGTITNLLGGVRYSELEYESFPRIRDQRTFSDDELDRVNQICRTAFPESGFLTEPLNGQNMVTNVDENGNVLPSGTGNTFATFDPICLVNEFTGGDWAWPTPGPSVQNIDVTETTIAGYIQANYDTEFAGYPVRGNFGVRVVNTEVDSIGLRTTFTTVPNDDGTISVEEDDENFFSVSGGSDYTEILPSASMVMDLREDLLLRGGIFRGMSRPDPSEMGFGRAFNVDDDDAMSIEDLVATATAPGNPDLEPLMSWDFDIAIEWYPNEDSILAFGAYYKSFQGGFENVVRTEPFIVDGQVIEADVTTVQTTSDDSTLWGIEV
ncbi:MAG: TonB-dependent receptor, partial [Xanthomonadales bacterium]|nr:TonB-dependent receptor [Xanthomonadales bacterium]